MPWNLSSDRPIFLQIVERIEMDIISGVYQPGHRLPAAMIEGLKQQIAEEKIREFFEAMKHLGISKEETLQLIQQHTTI